MRRKLLGGLGLVLLCTLGAQAQAAQPESGNETPPPKRYANTPPAIVPYGQFAQPYALYFLEPIEYLGGARDKKAHEVEEVRLGLLAPLENNPEMPFGLPMRNGALLALEEANARGGYQGRPFVLMEHNDQAFWGASSNEIVKMDEEGVWAILGSVDGSSTHIILRVSLKLEIPIVNTASTDPTVTETNLPWIVRTFIDDRQQGYALAEYIYEVLGLKRIGILRVNARYGRMGVVELADAARRLGNPVALQTKYERGSQDFSQQLRMLQAANVEGIVLWGEAPEAGQILRQMRAAGMAQPVFGGDRLVTEELLQIAGPAAEGLVATYTYDPTRADPRLEVFRKNFRQRFGEEPDHFAVHAYDGMNLLIEAIQKAGLNRGRIRDALTEYTEYDGIAGRAILDATHNNIAPPTLALVREGRFVFQPTYSGSQAVPAGEESSSTPYARMADRAPRYEGPDREAEKDIREEEIKIGLLVPLTGSQAAAGRALQLAAELAIEEANQQENSSGRGFRLLTRDTNGSWGRASGEVVNLIYADKVVALLTSMEGATAHLTEQVATKAAVPVLSLAPDTTTTQINLPWIFRCVPSEREEAALLAKEVYAERGYKKVALVMQDYREGRLGGSAFRAAVPELDRLMTILLPQEPAASDFDHLLEKLLQERIEALVLWTKPAEAGRLVSLLRESGADTEIYLSVEAAQAPFFAAVGKKVEGVHVIAPAASLEPGLGSESFAARYEARSGEPANPAAAATFDCVRLLVGAANEVGPNRARIQDYLAAGLHNSEEAGQVAFDPQGNLKNPWTVRPLPGE
jgi:ABC-type branched-subunit amino acid transport system substrate-binding protein